MDENINFGSMAWFNSIILAVLYSDASRKLLSERIKDINFKKDFNLTKYFKPSEIINLREHNNKFNISTLKKGFLTQLYLKPFFKLLKIKPLMLVHFPDNVLAYNMKNHVKMIEFDEDYTNFQSRIICEKYKERKLARDSDVFIIETVDLRHSDSVKNVYNDFSYHYIDNIDIAKLSNQFVYNDIEYILDSIIITNYNKSCMSHIITGFTMNNKKYIYTSLSKDPIEFDWYSNRFNKYYLDISCNKLKKITKNISITNNFLKFSFNKGKRLFVYVKK